MNEVNEYIMNSMFTPNMATKHVLSLVDICDYLVLTMSRTPPGCTLSTLDRARQLYQEMEIQAEVTHTPFSVTKETLDFIASVCGRHIPIDKTTIPKLLEDISKIMEFQALQKSWASTKLSTRRSRFTASSSDCRCWISESICTSCSSRKYMRLVPDSADSADKPAAETDENPSIKAMPPTSQPLLTDLQGYEAHQCTFGVIDDVQPLNGVLPEVALIVYHSLYNVALVVKEQKHVLQYVCEDFPEFKIITDFPIEVHGKDLYEQAKPFFHQKIFEEEADLQKKVDAFRSLYNLALPSCHKPILERDERTEVHGLMKRLFDISTEPKERIKAVDLYQKVGALVPGCDRAGHDAALHKRLAIYFMEMGLTRKRFSDGVYYYGIRWKQSEASTASIEDLMKQRNYATTS